MSEQIYGTVTDGYGNPVPDAGVTVFDSNGNVVASTDTTALGNYNPVLPSSGTYDVSVLKTGYSPAEETGVSVGTDESVEVDFSLSGGHRVRGRLDSETDDTGGVLGTATARSGLTIGVIGLTATSDRGAGVEGIATNVSGSASGVEGVARGAGITLGGGRLPAAGVTGSAGSEDGPTAGVYGVDGSDRDGNAGVEGVSSGTSGETYGVRGRTQSPVTGAAGVFGESAESGETYGVVGTTDSANGYGLYTPDDANLGGNLESPGKHTVSVDGDRALKLGPTGTRTDASGNSYTVAGNVVAGYGGNAVSDGVAGATIGGGGNANTFTRESSTLTGNNEVTDDYGTIGGGAYNRAGDAADANDSSYATVSGGFNNVASGDNATIGGGGSNEAKGETSTVGGGLANKATRSKSTVSGGFDNKATGKHATVAGGDSNTADDDASTVGGGAKNEAKGYLSTIAGGGGRPSSGQTAHGNHSTIGGGSQNRTGEAGTFKGDHATIPGGMENVAEGDYSFAAGRLAKALANGTFVWGDASSQKVVSDTADEFKVQAGGGAVVYSQSDLSTGVLLGQGSGSWSKVSTRTVKTGVEPVDSESVLAAVEDLPVTRWEYDSEEDAVHMGPMAEDFHDAFGLGPDRKHITNVDADGVALAAIKGLARRLRDRDDRIDRLEAETDRKGDRIDRLEAENERLRDRLAAVEDRVGIDRTRSEDDG